jgi:hypothetical protein
LTCPTSTLNIKTVMNNPWKIKNARDRAYELLEEGMVNPQAMAEMCLQYMSCDDIEDMLLSNDIIEEEEVTND